MNISSDKKKELQAAYKIMKTDMGIFAITNTDTNKYFLVTTSNLKGKINSTSFQLRSGGHPNKELQRDWQQLGPDHFEIKILEQMEYDEERTDNDYSDDLELLKMIWTERLAGENALFY